MREVLHFCHGNGFPSSCYQQLLIPLKERFDCYYIDRVGHAPEYPVTENWHFLVQEVTNSIKQQTSQPVIGIGHSLGGILSLLAAIEQPSLFKAVILLDSPLLSRLKSHLIRLSKLVGLIDHVTPAFRTRERCRYWKSREEALSYLKSKPLFKQFTEACFNDYIEYGMIYSKAGYALRFDPTIEYQIYRTIPHILHDYEGKLRVPTTLIYGNKSNVVKHRDLDYMKKYYNINHIEIKGTHMFPMERPEETADLIQYIVDGGRITC